MNYVRLYQQQIASGKIITSKEVANYYKLLVEQMDQPDFPYYFNEKAGQYAIDFIQKYCRHYQGEKAGQLIKLELFQLAFVQNLFGWLEKGTDNRRYREYWLEVARKHGKSFLSACIAIYMLVADGEQGAEVYSAATKLDQAKIIYTAARNIVEQDKDLRAVIKPTREGLYFKMTRSIMKPLPSESKSLDGLNSFYVALDECHEQRDRGLYDVLRTSLKARVNGLMGAITTSGFYRGGLYDTNHAYACDVANGVIKDERFFPAVYKLDDEKLWTNPKYWAQANPGLGTIKSYTQLADDVERAKNDTSFLPTLLTKDFNIQQTENKAWLPFKAIVNETVVDMDYLMGSYAIAGCDLSATTDLTCCTLLIRKANDKNFYVLQHYFIPRSKILFLQNTKSKEAPYELWEQQGWITINEGSQVDFHLVTQWFLEMVAKYDIRPIYVCYDRALSGYWVPEMTDAGFDMLAIPQGPFTWSANMKQLGALLEDGLVVYQNNPILRWCLANVAKKSTNADGIETIQPIKLHQQRRIDGFVSLLNAFVGYNKKLEEYESYL